MEIPAMPVVTARADVRRDPRRLDREAALEVGIDRHVDRRRDRPEMRERLIERDRRVGLAETPREAGAGRRQRPKPEHLEVAARCRRPMDSG